MSHHVKSCKLDQHGWSDVGTVIVSAGELEQSHRYWARRTVASPVQAPRQTWRQWQGGSWQGDMRVKPTNGNGVIEK
jgi:hypothetical protein